MKLLNKFVYLISKQKFYYNLSYVFPFKIYCKLSKKNSMSIRVRNKAEQIGNIVELSMSNDHKGDLFLRINNFTGLLSCFKLYLEFLKP